MWGTAQLYKTKEITRTSTVSTFIRLTTHLGRLTCPVWHNRAVVPS